jgi:hypothetical protein
MQSMMISQTCATSIIMKHFLSDLFDSAILSDPRAQYNGQSAEKRARAEQKRSNSSVPPFARIRCEKWVLRRR